VRRLVLLVLFPLFFLAACGGGSNSGNLSSGSGSSGSGSSGSGSSGSGSSGSGSSGSGSSGSGSSGSGSNIAGAAANVATITVDQGPSGTSGVFNTPFVTVTVCAPGSTTNCQTIDHIEVDTGSYGLRIISSVLSQTVLAALPNETTNISGSNLPIVECTMFGDGYSWGSVRTADLTISGEKATNLPIQIIGDPAFPNVYSDCAKTGTQENTVATFGANGIIGVGPFAQDCGQGCVDSTQYGFYYSCPTNGGTCAPVQVTLAQEVTNPVSQFTTDKNGVIVEMPAIADAGALSATGALVFGIGTQSNNALGNATVLTTDTNFGYISVTFGSTSYPNSFIDSGSNLYYFNTNTQENVATCSISSQTFFCPTAQQSLSATNLGVNGTQSTVNFNVGNAKTLFNNNPSFSAFDNVAAPNSDPKSFDYGLPFFYGRFVYTAIEGQNTSGGMGPYFAY
jgi:hypothetical protein